MTVRRIFYISLGAAAGVVAVRRVAQAAKALTPESLAGSLVQSVGGFVDDVREGMARRENELREAMGLDDTEDSDDEDPHDPGSLDSGRPGAGRHRAGRSGAALDEEVDALLTSDLAASNGRRRAF